MLLAVPAQAFGEIRHTFRPAGQAKQEGIMNTGSSKSLDSGAWRDLYKAALFEVDNARLQERIAQAEKALARRALELFHIAGDNSEEEEVLAHQNENANPLSTADLKQDSSPRPRF
jgi:hypothetical protein